MFVGNRFLQSNWGDSVMGLAHVAVAASTLAVLFVAEFGTKINLFKM